MRDHYLVVTPSGAGSSRLPRRILDELSDFFFHGHLVKERIHTRIDRRVVIPCGICPMDGGRLRSPKASSKPTNE